MRVCGMVPVGSNREQEPMIHIQSFSDLAFLALRHSHWITLIRALMVKMPAAGKHREEADRNRNDDTKPNSSHVPPQQGAGAVAQVVKMFAQASLGGTGADKPTPGQIRGQEASASVNPGQAQKGKGLQELISAMAPSGPASPRAKAELRTTATVVNAQSPTVRVTAPPVDRIAEQATISRCPNYSDFVFTAITLE